MAKDLLIAIDGPAASGKSTVARLVAARLNGFYFNTGDMYRTVTWCALRHGVDPRTTPESVPELLDSLDLDYQLGPDGVPRLILNGEPVPQSAIRSPAVAAHVSFVARIPEVRGWLVTRQRRARDLGTVVMEGRDIGTVVLPDAHHKFFITATPEVRAQRRLNQAGETVDGATVESVAAEIAERDRIDRSRSIAPLRPAADAIVIDTSELTPDNVVDQIMMHIQKGTGR